MKGWRHQLAILRKNGSKGRETDDPNVPENIETDDQMPRESQKVIEDITLNQFVNAALYENSGTLDKSKTLI